MPNCCYSDEYNSKFDSTRAHGSASRFRRQGLKGSSADVASALTGLGSRDLSMLEVGGGIGQIQVTLLEKGIAARAINVELSSNWEEAARQLLAERGLQDKVTRVIGDFVDQAEMVPKADVVVLHRVVCCYPDWRNLLGAAVNKADRLIALTFPRDKWFVQAGILGANAMFRIRGQSFRAYLHPPAAMISLLADAGFSIVHDQDRGVWRTVVATRDRRSGSR